MFKVSVLYPNSPDAKFDLEYYRGTHCPMVIERCAGAITRLEIDRGVAGVEPDSPAPFRVVAHLLFDSPASMQQSFGKHIAEFAADLPNFTDIAPIVQISDVDM